MPKYTKRSVALITAGVVAVSGGAAWAAWSLTGVGESSAAAGQVVELDVTDASIVLDPTTFFPGSKHDVTFSVSNPNPFPVLITGFAIEQIASKNAAACASTNVVELAGATTTSTLTLPANSGPQTIKYEDAIGMIADAANGCQGVGFDFDVALDATSNAS
ncbi:hypothetical protein FHR83_005007 [Actinoplanes campanulatus]|uniref:Ribosomally synthesized peptide with SipW-like signal peptide n=1 Tax=Actinoplanes campanulatus TaxID=113559 RepID=A0A7W5FGC9_9ACTN|nr:hypothetical protein [Actinoplanes campanulatus]MBB3097332.1 hypothetical protein [Actinoplanes campanulatus]GGN17295.1 hypothetical protein GCM10010109_29910 [Actinoplanes campanulatus]GID37485.1 hypothetical protein Aca09nite_39910 [Actinoplanes campanulatus]